MNLFNLLTVSCDAPQPWGLYFQDTASPQMEALVELHDNIMFYLVIILFGVAWIMVSIIRNYVINRSPMNNKYINYISLYGTSYTVVILVVFSAFHNIEILIESVRIAFYYFRSPPGPNAFSKYSNLSVFTIVPMVFSLTLAGVATPIFAKIEFDNINYSYDRYDALLRRWHDYTTPYEWYEMSNPSPFAVYPLTDAFV